MLYWSKHNNPVSAKSGLVLESEIVWGITDMYKTTRPNNRREQKMLFLVRDLAKGPTRTGTRTAYSDIEVTINVTYE
jgi:hypothetical protein